MFPFYTPEKIFGFLVFSGGYKMGTLAINHKCFLGGRNASGLIPSHIPQ